MHERLLKIADRATMPVSDQEFVARRMELLASARYMIDNLDLGEDYEPSVHEVVALAEFLAGDRSGE